MGLEVHILDFDLDFGFSVWGSDFGFGFWVWVWRFRFGIRIWDLGFRLGIRVWIRILVWIRSWEMDFDVDLIRMFWTICTISHPSVRRSFINTVCQFGLRFRSCVRVLTVHTKYQE